MFVAGENCVVMDKEQRIVVIAKDLMQVAALEAVPDTQVVKTDTGWAVTMPWRTEACQILNNVGIDTTLALPFWYEPMLQIEGKYKPMAHQALTAAFMILNPRCYVLSDCRLGKTGSAILAIDYMQRHHLFDGGCLVLTTLTTMESVWKLSINETLPNDAVEIVHGKGLKANLQRSAQWYVTNYDSVRLHKDAFKQAVNEKRIGYVLIDELTHMGNSSSQRSKAVNELVNTTNLRYVAGMTGSPGSNPEPVYGMVKVVNPVKMPYKSKQGWLNDTTYQYGAMSFMRKPNANAGELIRKVMSPAVRFRKEAVLDLPPVVEQERRCALSVKQKQMVDEFRADAMAIAESGEVITPANGAVLLSKLLQVPLGFVIKDNKEVADIPHDDRTKTIVEIIEETDRKVVIFSMFKHRLKTLKAELEKAGYSCGLIDGSVVGAERSKILIDFKKAENPRILIAHPTTVGFGTELSAADTLIIDGPLVLGDFSYTQTLERLSSPKQQSDKISIVKVYATQEERKMFQRLAQGQTSGQIVAALFEDLKNNS